MTLLEAIREEAMSVDDKVLRKGENIDEFLKAIKEMEAESYTTRYPKDLLTLKVMIHAMQRYGRAKWKEAVKAAREAIVQDSSCEPEFED